jgi:hypothetical protein
MDELAERRRQKQLAERRELLKRADRWTPREALEAALLDMDLGEVKDVEAITVVMATHVKDGDESCTTTNTYVGTNGATGPKETFWIIGNMMKAIYQRFE